MGLVTPLIQFCWAISSRMVEPSCSQSFLDKYCRICRVLSSLGVYRRPCVSPINAPLLIQYVLYVIFPRLLTLPLTMAYQHSSVLSTKVSLTCYGRRERRSPRAMAPSPSKKNSGLANPHGRNEKNFQWKVGLANK